MTSKGYPDDWPVVALKVKSLAGWRCVRCGHRHESPKEKLPCDSFCMPQYHPETYELQMFLWSEWVADRQRQRILTVHHLDGIKYNRAWWNLAALCQVCHLYIQRVTEHNMAYWYDREDFMGAEGWLEPYMMGCAQEAQDDHRYRVFNEYNPPPEFIIETMNIYSFVDLGALETVEDTGE